MSRRERKLVYEVQSGKERKRKREASTRTRGTDVFLRVGFVCHGVKRRRRRRRAQQRQATRRDATRPFDVELARGGRDNVAREFTHPCQPSRRHISLSRRRIRTCESERVRVCPKTRDDSIRPEAPRCNLHYCDNVSFDPAIHRDRLSTQI